ncbi:MAG: glycosyltransferase [Candidatus Riflebacteria bacterium]|nr:glycosyltransferase [Candidatus Riflebacteria bacterium]
MTGRSIPARVVLLLQDLKFGGTQRQALELARGLDPARFRVTLWVMQAGDDFVPLARSHGLEIVWLGRGSYVWPPALFGLGCRLRSDRPDLVLMLTGIPNIWGRLLGRWIARPVLVASIRGTQDPDLQHERWLWSLAHHHVCNASSLKGLLMERCPVAAEAVTVIPNGVDPERFGSTRPSRDRRRQVVLSLGRLVPEKDHLGLIAAFERIAPGHPGAELRIVGDGPLERQLTRRIERSAARDRIFLEPGRLSIDELLAGAWCLALPSRHEGLPNVVLEAMASGVPVVASALPGLVELLEGDCGLLSPPGDVEALSCDLDRILSDGDLWTDLGRRGRQRVTQRYGHAAMVGAYEELFSRLLARYGRPVAPGEASR